MNRDPNSGDDYEAHYFPAPVKQRDVDRDQEDEAEFYAELDKDLSAQRRTEIAISATPEQFRDMWRKLA